MRCVLAVSSGFLCNPPHRTAGASCGQRRSVIVDKCSADVRQPGQHVTSHPHLVLCHSSRCAIVIARASARGLVAAASAEVRAGRSPWHCRTLCRLCRSRGNHNDGLRVQPWWSANNQHALYLCRHLEYVRHFSPGRHPSIGKFAGSTLGALCGWLVIALLRRRVSVASR